MKHLALPVLLSTAIALSSACGTEDDPATDSLGSDASAGQTPAPEAGSPVQDAGPTPDAGVSSGLDASTTQPSRDASSDASPQTGIDASTRSDAASSSDSGVSNDAAPTVDAATGSDAGGSTLPRFSFFVTSLNAMRTLSKSENGFGGDLRFGETGEGAGLRGADKICAAAAEIGMKGASAKQWRAFLSTTTVNARTRIGQGPWYDRMGRLVAMNLTALLKERPEGAEMIIRDDLPNETGAPNKAGSAIGTANDNHDTVTGSNASGDWDNGSTCSDWTSTSGGGSNNGPRVGHSWPGTNSGRGWIMAHRAPGCAPSVSLVQMGAGSGTGIGNGGGYGGIYCFALTP